MTQKDKQTYALVAVLVLIVGGIWLFKAKHTTDTQNGSQTQQSSSSTNQNNNRTGSGQESTWTGVLKASDNKSKGNLMLVTPERNIYIKTSRDYSAVMGKKVKVTYQGTWQNFVLGDIILQEQ